jgi:flagellar secretion chaperone FliS
MRINDRAMESYGAVRVDARVVDANSAQLVLMLFDGLIENVLDAKRHMMLKEIRQKGEHINRASRIIIGLQSTLNFEKGGDLALNLDDLYNYFLRRLIAANASNDPAIMDEIYDLVGQIRLAWLTLPGCRTSGHLS